MPFYCDVRSSGGEKAKGQLRCLSARRSRAWSPGAEAELQGDVGLRLWSLASAAASERQKGPASALARCDATTEGFKCSKDCVQQVVCLKFGAALKLKGKAQMKTQLNKS